MSEWEVGSYNEKKEETESVAVEKEKDRKKAKKH